jgi:hypothetical protein
MTNLTNILKEILLEEKEKRDRCLRIADRKYDKPSAYKSGAVVKCRQGKIWKDIKEELSNVDYYKKLSDLIIQKLPKVKPNFIRLWRGNRPNEVGKNPSYTSSLEGIALPFYYGYHEDGLDAVISYIDIPKEEVKKYIIGGGAEDSEFILPKELLNQVKTVDKNIYKDFENQNFPSAEIQKGGLTSFDDAMAKMFGKALNEKQKETLRTWFKRKGAPGKTGGWVDCNAPDGKGGYKPCGRQEGEKRSKYPACRPTPAGCRDKGKGKKWGKTKENLDPKTFKDTGKAAPYGSGYKPT